MASEVSGKVWGPIPKPVKQVKAPKPGRWKQSKPIPVKGKVTKRWDKFRADWFKDNPGNWLGLYACHYCGQWFPKAQIDLDHVKNRGSHPELRFDLSNIVMACRPCHRKKTDRVA